MTPPPAAPALPSVLVDARGLRFSGIGRYLREILLHLLRDDGFGRFTLLGDPREIRTLADEAGAGARVRALAVPPAFYAPAAHARMAYLGAVGALRADVAFFPHYDVPPAGPLPPLVVTVHDLSHFILRDLFPAHKRVLASWLMRRAVSRARAVLVDAGSTRRDLLLRIPAAAGKVHVVPLGVGPAFFAPEGAPLPAPREPPYLLCVGNRKPHKNLEAAVEVLHRLREGYPELRLVLAGAPLADGGALLRHAAARGVLERVDDVGAVSDAELRELYAGTACFLLPSLYEGFGLPALEAMASGAPVVASDRASLPEVVGDAGLLADPEDPDALAAAVHRVLSDPALRAELRTRGLARAARHTWAAAATGTAERLRQAARAPHPPPPRR